MSKKSFTRLIRIMTGAFGTGKDENFSLEESFTKFEKFVHFWVLVWRSFVRNRCPVRASALSFTTLLALIPMLAVAMSVTSIFLKSEGKDQIETFIQHFVEYMVPNNLTSVESSAGPSDTNAPPPETTTTNLPPSAETNLVAVAAPVSPPTNAPSTHVQAALDALGKKQAAGYIHQFIQNTYSGALGATGVVFLLWTAIVMLARIEETFNDIWGVARGRNWLSRVVLYWATITLGPLLLVGALGLASGTHFQKTRALLDGVPLLEPVFSQLLPVIVISMTFALFYKLMPNTKVHFSAAFVGGLIAGTAWHLFNVASFYLGSRAVNASRIYGSLALVPLLMLGLYAVWVIVLFGAQVAYAYQNRESYLQERLAENVNQRGREFVALRLMTCIGQHFHLGLPPATIQQMSRELGIPSKLVQQVLTTMLAAKLVVEVSGAEPAYAPARPLDTINCHHILLAMRATQGQELVTREEPVREEVFGEFARIQAVEKEAASSVTMFALVNRAQARLELALPTAEERKENKAAPPVVELTELPQEPASETSPETPVTQAAIAPEPKPISGATTSTVAPAAEATTDDNLSFPL
ncbi:MAG: YihY family inner membrane protein [Pedosphaera sp.]|nr:YihY family inner membrane protein [Pedosphaera sp.]